MSKSIAEFDQSRTESFVEMCESGRIQTDLNDLQKLTYDMMFEINQQASKTMILQHQMIEILRAAPKFVSNYLQVEHE